MYSNGLPDPAWLPARLRPFEAADAGDVCAIRNEAEYLRFAPARFTHAGSSLEQALHWCTDMVEQQRLDGAGIAFAAVADGRDHARCECTHAAVRFVRHVTLARESQ